MHRAYPLAGKCIHCAFRAQQSVLRARRLNVALPVVQQQQRHVTIRRVARGPSAFRPEGRERAQGRRSKGEGKSVIRKYGSPQELRQSAPSHDFEHVLDARLSVARKDLKDVPLLAQLGKEAAEAGRPVRDFESIWKTFIATVRPSAKSGFGLDADQQNVDTLNDLRAAYRERGRQALDDRIRYAFYAHLTGARFTKADIRNQREMADLRYPTEWYPATRIVTRTIHLHVGPTNSGKTYHALKRLEQADHGIYAGPLRLLAHEVYTRMNAKGRPCALITGDERRYSPETEDGETPDTQLYSCTVEMMPLNKPLDVAVIDEIQMIGSKERGWAWTQALLGVQAREVHLCGEERTVPLLQEICASLGEELKIHRYERLSPLKVAETSLKGSLKNLKKGDCIVSFSVMGIHALRKQIERATGKKVATVYGSLPPETRAQQARLFNDPDNDYDYLVASDAVGMGLNLAIKRIIFEHTSKFDGMQRRQLQVADIKQIAGRAGRYKVASHQNTEAESTTEEEKQKNEDLSAAKGEPSPSTIETSPQPSETTTLTPIDYTTRPPPPTNLEESTGIVTTLEDFDFPLIRHAMTALPEPISTAGLCPPASVVERFASYFPPSTPFSYILTRLHELSQTHSRYHLCGLNDQLWIADLIEPIKDLSVSDRNIITASPASKGDMELWSKLLPAYARVIASQSGGNILDIPELPLEILDAEVSASREYLRKLEQLHKGVVSYLWLSHRFAGIFETRALATHVKELVEEKIESVLGMFSFGEKERERVVRRREREVLEAMARGFEEEEGRVEHAVEVVGSQGESEGVGEVGREGEFDRFGGEEDLPIDDPAQTDVLFDETSPTTEAQAGFRETFDIIDVDTTPSSSPPDTAQEGSPNDFNDADVTSPHQYSQPSSSHDNAASHAAPPTPHPSVPPKHLHTHIDATVKEVGTDVGSRP